ncbi:hypothetical protein ACPVPU_03340 [Sphingomonas sp. CJ99]
MWASLPRAIRPLALAAACLAAPAAAQESGITSPPGPWQGNYQLLRDDPRIRTRGGADLIRMQLIQSKGEDAVTVSWIAGRAICEDPLAKPCEWIGANGTTRGRIVDDTLIIALPLSADAADPAILMMRRDVMPARPVRYSGVMANAQADWAYRFTAIAE